MLLRKPWHDRVSSATRECSDLHNLDLPSCNGRQQAVWKIVCPVIPPVREEGVDLIEDFDCLHVHLSIAIEGLQKSRRLALPTVGKSEGEDVLTNLGCEFAEKIARFGVFC
jgi:hypothetical protein